MMPGPCNFSCSSNIRAFILEHVGTSWKTVICKQDNAGVNITTDFYELKIEEINSCKTKRSDKKRHFKDD